MYQFEIFGEDCVREKAVKIGKSIAVSVPKDWCDVDVIVIKSGSIESSKKVHEKDDKNSTDLKHIIKINK